MEPRAETFNAGEVPKPRKYRPPTPPRVEMSMTKLPDGTCRYVPVVPTAPASRPVMVSRVKKQGRQQKGKWISTTSAAENPAVPSPEIASPLAAMGSGEDGFAGGEVPKPRKYRSPTPPRLEMSMTKLPDGTCRYVPVVPTAPASRPVTVSIVKKQGRHQKGKWISTTSDPANSAVPSPEIASPLAAMGSGDDGFAGGADPAGTLTPLAAISALGSRQNDFIPYTVRVQPGQDISAIISSLGQNGHVSVLSTNGVVSRVELHQSATSSYVTTYEGRFEILRLTGLLSEISGLRVLLAGQNCQVFGGRLAGIMIAASPVQVILGSFTANDR